MKKKLILVTILLIVFVIGGISGYKVKSLFSQYLVFDQDVSERLEGGISCHSVVSNILLVENQGKVKKAISESIAGTDKIAVKLDGKELSFLTSAAVGTGISDADKFKIIDDTKEHLIAAYVGDRSIDTFVLNKKTGKAIWSKNNSNYLFSNDVENQALLLNCF